MECNVCGNRIAALHKLLFKQTVGLECQKCHSILTHSKVTVASGLLFLGCFLALFVAAIEYGGAIWIAGSLISLGVLIGSQLSAPLTVVYENKHHQ